MARKKKSDTQQEELLNLFYEMDKSHQQAFIFGIIYNSLNVGNFRRWMVCSKNRYARGKLHIPL